MAFLNLKKKRDCSQSTRVEREKRDRREREGCWEGGKPPLPSLPFLALLPLIALLLNRRPRDNCGQVSATNSHSTADETQGMTRPRLPDQPEHPLFP